MVVLICSMELSRSWVVSLKSVSVWLQIEGLIDNLVSVSLCCPWLVGGTHRDPELHTVKLRIVMRLLISLAGK
jgi:hypothetical protein